MSLLKLITLLIGSHIIVGCGPYMAQIIHAMHENRLLLPHLGCCPLSIICLSAHLSSQKLCPSAPRDVDVALDGVLLHGGQVQEEGTCGDEELDLHAFKAKVTIRAAGEVLLVGLL